jgi:2'-5' RNA ligase
VTAPHGVGHTLGVAIEIPAPHGPELDAVRARYSPDDGDMPAHVTILAPVDVDADVLEAVITHLARVAAETAPFRLCLRGTGTFRPVSPVVFVAVAEGISSCEQLERRVRSGDLAVETRFPYHPHVTIAHDVPDSAMDRALAELADYRADVAVTSMSLHENVDGRWRLLREFTFGG